MKLISRLAVSGLLLLPSLAAAQNPTGTFTDVNVCYTAEDGSARCERFQAPDTTPDLGPVNYIERSPIDPSRQLERLPTFGLAKFHWWLFSQALFRAQRQYSECIGGIKELQGLLGEYPIDGPLSPLYGIIVGVREYEVPFEPVQIPEGQVDKPPTKADAIRHALFAVDSVNLVVFHTGLCRQTLESYRDRIRRGLGQ